MNRSREPVSRRAGGGHAPFRSFLLRALGGLLFGWLGLLATAVAAAPARVPATAAAASAAAPADTRPIVILLSWDGVRHDYLDRQPAARLPALARMQRQGARAASLRAGWPSSTFPGHVTLATGAWAERHGIVDNSFIDRRRGEFRMGDAAGWLQAEPLWIAAERQGVPAATFYWVGSESDWRGARQRYRQAPFDGSVDEPTKVRQILAWLDLPKDKAPRLIMSWWHGADDAGHDHGPDSNEVAEAMRAQDAALGQLLAGIDARRLWPRLTLLIVSDHGMTAVDRVFDLPGWLAEQGIAARVSAGSGVAHVFLERSADLGRVERGLKKVGGLRTWRNAELPAAMHLRHVSRTGDLVVVAQPPVALHELNAFQRPAFRFLRWCCDYRTGAHGYDPALPAMQGVLLAMGRGIAPGQRLPSVSQVDVAPTVARLLRIAPPRDAIGQAIAGVGSVGIGTASPQGRAASLAPANAR